MLNGFRRPKPCWKASMLSLTTTQFHTTSRHTTPHPPLRLIRICWIWGYKQLPPYDCPEIKNSAMWVVPIYTVLGSRLGASMILKYIEQEQLQLPTHFLREGKQGMRTWRELLANLDRPIEPKSAEQLKTYTEKFWKVIHQRNVQDYATSRRGETE